jgi:hypothetical protein
MRRRHSRAGDHSGNVLRRDGTKVLYIESEDPGYTCLNRTLEQYRIVDRSALNSPAGHIANQTGIISSGKARGCEMLKNVFLNAEECFLRGMTKGRRQPRQDCISLRQAVCRNNAFILPLLNSLKKGIEGGGKKT